MADVRNTSYLLTAVTGKLTDSKDAASKAGRNTA